MRRPTRASEPWIVDSSLAVVFFGLAVVELTHPVEEMHQRAALRVDLVLQAAFCATLVLRTHYPRVTLVAMSAALLVPALVAPRAVLFFGDFVPLLIVTWTVTRRAPEEWSRLAWLSGAVFWAAMVLHSGRYFEQVRNPLLVVAIPLAVWGAASVVRRLDEQSAELSRAVAELEVAQAGGRRDAVLRERARVAAEMHDVVAHAVSLMVVQVGDARLGLEADGRARPGLREAETTGRRALVELRRCLGVLRGSPADDERPAVPC